MLLLIFVIVLPFVSPTAATLSLCGRRNERYYNDSVSPTCDWNCQDLNRPCRLTTTDAQAGCYCRLGYARNLQRQCIPVDECVKDCFLNERPVYPDLRGCEKSCLSLRNLCYYDRKCVCAPGYCRNRTAQCVPIP